MVALDTAGQKIPGMKTWSSRLTKYGYTNMGDCTPRFTCTATSTSDQAVCTAAKNFLALQNSMHILGQFRCDLFKEPNGPGVCDPANMLHDADGSWTGSCVKQVCTAGSCTITLERKEINCNFDEFVVYVNKYADRITTVFARVDDTVPLVEEKIKTGLKGWMDQNFLDPIRDLVEESGCGFLMNLWREMVSGLCYQGWWGLKAIGVSYVSMAALCVIMILLAYCIWRRQIDNSNASADGALTKVVPSN